MIVRDEEPVLGRCLESVRGLADEIIVADTGSVDRTPDIARSFGAEVVEFPWVDDFAAARNFAFSKATCDYQMWLDADDFLPPESIEMLLRRKANLTADVVMLPYQVGFDALGNPTLTYYRERLLKRARGFRWEGAVHEAITPAGEILYIDAPVQHRKERVNDPDRNLRIFEKELAAGHALSPREQYYYARELYYHGAYDRAAAGFEAFLAQNGWVEDRITACLLLSKCHTELGQQEQAKTALYRSFLYDTPRAEICCEIGRLLMEESNWAHAVFWFKAAIDAPFPTCGFQEGDVHDYIPYLQLCVCYDRMGNLAAAKAYNDRAGRIKPQDAAYLANLSYFREKLG